ncbi:MAG TPA: type IX secretion system membrane protein PorP/SprF [Cytophagaceae bacterium]
MRSVNLILFPLFACILICSFAKAQQEPLFTQYMFNGLAINPAYAGSQEALNLTLLARKQWLAIEGAPSTQTLSVHSPLKNERVALGMTFINDQIGVTRQYGTNIIYAYRIPMKNGKLSMGLQSGISRYRSNFSSLHTKQPNDPTFSSDEVSTFSLNFGTGIYYSTQRFYAGLSVPHILSNHLRNSGISDYGKQRRHYFFTTGAVLKLSPDLKLKPSVLVKMVEGAPVQLDLNSNLLIKEVLWLGVSYRSFSSANLIFQVQLTNQLSLGYSYDMALNQLSTVSSGSHEFMLTYNFHFYGSKVLTPRYF